MSIVITILVSKPHIKLKKPCTNNNEYNKCTNQRIIE